jgi:hypothetical protein
VASKGAKRMTKKCSTKTSNTATETVALPLQPVLPVLIAERSFGQFTMAAREYGR